MKRRLSTIIILSICTFTLSARTVQKGVVKEYNEKDQKTPLSDVNCAYPKPEAPS